MYTLDNLPGVASHPWLADLIEWGNPLTPVVECFRSPLFEGEVPSIGNLVYLVVETLVALVLGPWCAAGSTTGSPRKCDREPAVVQALVARVGRQAEVRRELDTGQQRGEKQRCAEARIAAARAQRSNV